MIMKSLLFLLLAAAAVATEDESPFMCTIKGGSTQDHCVKTLDDDGSHCVWCSLRAYGFCVNEATAETMEQQLPTVDCDRFDSDDDAADDDDDDEATDDADESDDKAPKEDDISPGDDTIPDDYWKCLQAKDAKSCPKDCTWCMSKAGFGLCLSGPTADFAKHSDYFTCKKEAITKQDSAAVADPYDSSCLMAYLQDASKEGCVSAVDQDGKDCEWCDFRGVANLCLTEEQAQMGESMGITCESPKPPAAITAQDPYDPSCLQAYIQDQSEEGCKAATNADGDKCEYCTIGGSVNVCLTDEQAQVAEQFGAECEDADKDDDDIELTDREWEMKVARIEEEKENPYDTTCLMEYLQDQSKEGCTSSTDADGTPCEFCTFTGVGSITMCLTELQANTAEGVGAECAGPDDNATTVATAATVRSDMLDRTCIEAFLQDGTKEGCKATSDALGDACKWCFTPHFEGICLTDTQGDLVTQLGFWCDKEEAKQLSAPLDPTCLSAGFEAGGSAQDACGKTSDSDGQACVWCSKGMVGMCLSPEQANMAGSLLDCGADAEEFLAQE